MPNNVEAVFRAYEKAFHNTWGAIIFDLTAGGRVATLRWRRTAAGNVTCWLKYSGTSMRSGKAGGGGYDKQAASLAKAARRVTPSEIIVRDGFATPQHDRAIDFLRAAQVDDGAEWRSHLEKARFAVYEF